MEPLQFSVNFLEAIAIGIVIGIVGCLILKYVRAISHIAYAEALLLFVLMYTSYALGDFCSTSGVTSLLVTGLVLSQYGYYSLSANGKFLSPVVFRNLAYLMQGIVFIMLGLSFFNFSTN
jgi:monovalent cation/hydrogen antiporter